MKDKHKNLFQIKIFVVLFALTAAVTWASAFPLIKIGFSLLEIASGDTGAKTLFAGIRFLLAGVLVLAIAKITKHDFSIEQRIDILWLVVFGTVNTALHYFCFYIGLSNSTGSRSAIFDALGTFILIILACACFKDEHMTSRKVAGCILGFVGVAIINVGSGTDMTGTFAMSGDGMLVLSSLCAAFGGVLTRIVTKKMDALVATGISLALGGIMLIASGLCMGGTIKTVNLPGIIVLLMLVLVSAIGFSLYNQLICFNPVGEIAIFNSFIPILGAVMSCVFLGEYFYSKYLVAGLLVSMGVYIINKPGKSQNM